MKSYSLENYEDAGCKQLEGINLHTFLGLHTVMGGRICDTGCCYFDSNPECFKRLTSKVYAQKPIYVETVREESARRGISIKQVRRERRDNH